MHQEMVFFCHTFLAGVFLAACYDILRIFRNLVTHHSFFTEMEDLFYWCLTGFFLFSVIYEENDGVIRIYALFSIGLGAWLYHAGPSEWLVGFFVKPIRKWRKRLKFLWDRVRIILCEQKSARTIRKRGCEKNGDQKNKKKKEKNREKGKSAE